MLVTTTKERKQAAALLRWYEQHGRTLPWRKTKNPYRILVSEIMLQQTQVSRGLIYYQAWLKRFPTWKTLAAASNADVIRAWKGLGYNRRALAIRDIAKQIVENGVPKNREAWLALKGIGPYTSAALALFSLGQKELPIDTNIRRVLGRMLLGIPFPQPEQDEAINQRGQKLLDATNRFTEIPQALFDLATLVCTKTPGCVSCPLKKICKAAPKFLSGRVQTPKAMIKKAVESRHTEKPYPDRIYRGRILRFVQESEHIVTPATTGIAVDPDFDPVRDTEWLEAMMQRLQKDGLLALKNGRLVLPE